MAPTIMTMPSAVAAIPARQTHSTATGAFLEGEQEHIQVDDIAEHDGHRKDQNGLHVDFPLDHDDHQKAEDLEDDGGISKGQRRDIGQRGGDHADGRNAGAALFDQHDAQRHDQQAEDILGQLSF